MSTSGGISNGAFTIDVPNGTAEESQIGGLKSFEGFVVEEDEKPALSRQQCAKARKFAAKRNGSRTAIGTTPAKEPSFIVTRSMKRTISISSESNTSQTDLQGHHQPYDTNNAWNKGCCCIWMQQVLADSIEEMLATNELSIVRRARTIMEAKCDEYVCHQMPRECRDIGVLFAAFNGNAPMLECFLNRGGDANAVDLLQRTALHYAASSVGTNAADCITLLAEHGADVNAWDLNGEATPLICAAASGRLDLMDALLKANADVNAGLADPKHPDGSSALLWAVRARSYACASRLIAAGAMVNSTQVYTEMPIHVAAVQGDVECMKLLLQKQADVRVLLGTERMNPLHLAAAEGNVGCIRLLLQTSKAEIDSVDSKGRTPLHLAALAQSVECISELLRNGARHDICDESKRSPLHGAVVKSSRSVDVVRMLIQAGANVNARDELDQTPLHLAAIYENSKLASILIQYGADFAAKNKGGNSALCFVVRRVPEALSAIPRRLDSAVLLTDHDPADPDCELHLDFRVLVPAGDQQQNGELRLLTALVMANQPHILQHPVIRAFLHLKWQKIRSLFLFSLFFHACFVIMLTTTIMSTYVIRENPTTPLEKNSPIDTFWHKQWDPAIVTGQRYVTLVFGILTACKEVFQMCRSAKEHFSDIENFAHMFIIFGMIAICIPTYKDGEEIFHEWQHHIAALVVIVAWLILMMHVGRFPVFGLYVQMFTTVAKNIGKLLVAYLSLIIGFSMGFAVLYPNTNMFANFPYSLLTTVVMMTGETDYNKLFNEETVTKVHYEGTTHLVFLAFILFVVIVLMNLLVGLAVSDIQGLQKSAGLDRLVRQARLIARMEGFIFFPWPIRISRASEIPWRQTLQRRLLVVPPSHRRRRDYNFRPNDPRDHRFPLDIKENLLKIVLQFRANKRGRHLPLFRTHTPRIIMDEPNEELCEEMTNRVDELFNNYMSQIISMNSTLEEQLCRIEQKSQSVAASRCHSCDCA